MNCEYVRPLLYRLIDNRLLADDETPVRAHVDNCAKCSQRILDISAIDEVMVDTGSEPLPASLRPKLLKAYRLKMADRRSRLSIFGRHAVVVRRAAVVALIAIGSSTATWLGVRPKLVPPSALLRMSESQVELDEVFPLRLCTTFTMKDTDGRTQRGVRIVSVQ